MNPLSKGKRGELLAAAYFLERDYEVYMGDGYASCDFVVYNGVELLRVEVRTATSYQGSAPWWCTGPRVGYCDIFAVVLPDGTVLLDPDRDVVLVSAAPP